MKLIKELERIMKCVGLHVIFLPGMGRKQQRWRKEENKAQRKIDGILTKIEGDNALLTTLTQLSAFFFCYETVIPRNNRD